MRRRNTKDEREHEREMEAVLRGSYFGSCPAGYLGTPSGENDLQNHVRRRLGTDRTVVVPWLNRIKDLRGAHILEIGCGTGSSTLALAESGATVVGVDVDETSLQAARERCRIYGAKASFIAANASALPPAIRNTSFDLIVFYASLEHMTIEERLAAMDATWQMLPIGGLWSMIETPNRLWYFDWHTSLLPFYLWLPDDLAFRYSKFSNRPRFNDLYREETPDAKLHFLRRGRGVSFHEMELSLGRLQTLEIGGWLDWTRQTESWTQRLRRVVSAEGQYYRALRRIARGVDEAYLQPRIDIVIRKTGRETR